MFRLPPLTPFVKKLLIALFAVYLAQVIGVNWAAFPLSSYLMLDTSSQSIETLWQLFTHIFAADTGPAYVFSMMISLFFLWWMLSPIEERFGPKRTLQLCLFATLGASIPAVITGMLIARPFPLFGPQPLLLAAISSFAWMYRGRGQLSLFGVINMKAEHLLWLTIALSVLVFLSSKDWVGLIADLGAIGAGVLFIEWLRRPPSRSKRPNFQVISGHRDQKDTWLN